MFTVDPVNAQHAASPLPHGFKEIRDSAKCRHGGSWQCRAHWAGLVAAVVRMLDLGFLNRRHRQVADAVGTAEAQRPQAPERLRCASPPGRFPRQYSEPPACGNDLDCPVQA